MNLSRKHLWVPVVGLLAIAISCKKQDFVPEENETTTQLRTSGVVPDDPELVAKVPLILSRSYLAKKATTKGPGKGKGGSTGTTTDQTAPSVSITSPFQSASVSGTVSIAVSASDNVGVSSVIVTINGTTLGADNSAPYAFSWNADANPDGVYTIEATAKDAVGNWSKSTISVTKSTTVVVDPPPPPPSTSEVSLAMPPVQNQGGEGSCVAFAVGYAARSAEQFYRSGAASYEYGSNVFSPEYLYNQTKANADCNSGASVTVALNFLMSNGIITWQSMPYSSSNGCSLLPTSSQTSEASNYRIASYSRLYSSDVELIKSMVQQKHPVIVTIIADNSFVNAKSGFVWKSYSGSGSLAHCLAIVGYDDAKNAWKVMNSWGTAWGDAGFSYIDYDFLPSRSGYAYVIN